MNYEDLQNTVVKSLTDNNSWDRAVSIDIEADLNTLQNPNGQILSISAARRIDGKIDIQNFILENETEEDEVRVFREFGDYCGVTRPLVLVGYGISRFDLPLLLVKMRQLDNLFMKEGKYWPGYWAFRDAVTRAYVLDVINPVRFEIGRFDNVSPKFLSLEKAISHKRFEHLPFRSMKEVVSQKLDDTKTKWDVIYNLWKDDRTSFIKYAEGDVHDTLLLAEDIFKINGQK